MLDFQNGREMIRAKLPVTHDLLLVSSDRSDPECDRPCFLTFRATKEQPFSVSRALIDPVSLQVREKSYGTNTYLYNTSQTSSADVTHCTCSLGNSNSPVERVHDKKAKSGCRTSRASLLEIW